MVKEVKQPEGKTKGDQMDINEELKKIIAEKAKTAFVSGYQASDEEVLGMILSQYFKWSGLSVLKACYYGLEDSNFHTENEEILKMIEKIEAHA